MSEEQWRAALGRNAEHYLKHFRKIAASGRRWVPGWNSAACVHSTAWFCYRRMYGWAFLNLIAPWLFLAAVVLLVPARGADNVALALLAVYLVGVFIVLPVFADSLYYRGLSKAPSVWTGLVAAALVLFSFASLLAMLLPQYADYTPRAKVSEAILAASGLRTAVTEFQAAHQRLPSAAEAAGLDSKVESRRVETVTWDAAQRAIVVTLRDPFPGKRFMLRATEDQGQLSWKCVNLDVERQHMPSTCRN